MTKQHVYFGIENLNLNDDQKATLVEVLQNLGPASSPSPALLNHWRIRLDGDAVIFEALWEEDNVSIPAFKGYLANIYDVSPDDIGASTNNVVFDERETAVVTFSYDGTDYIRVVFFGYSGDDWPTWEESGDETRVYLAANRDAWESEGV